MREQHVHTQYPLRVSCSRHHKITRDLVAITDEYLNEQRIILALILALFTFVNKFPPPHTNAVCTYAYVRIRKHSQLYGYIYILRTNTMHVCIGFTGMNTSSQITITVESSQVVADIINLDISLYSYVATVAIAIQYTISVLNMINPFMCMHYYIAILMLIQMLMSAMHGYFAGWFLQCFIPVYKYGLSFFHSIKQKALNKIQI